VPFVTFYKVIQPQCVRELTRNSLLAVIVETESDVVSITGPPQLDGRHRSQQLVEANVVSTTSIGLTWMQLINSSLYEPATQSRSLQDKSQTSSRWANRLQLDDLTGV
jgi:hypothetical protein